MNEPDKILEHEVAEELGWASTLAVAKQLGVSTKILTGDSVGVAGYIGGQLGLLAEDTGPFGRPAG
ncbi:MAG TPA: hypothetical protein VME46_13610 [Acidimicrobiales bacterium]|nr:hypothetical protein [Acidimicrobiales bacterium]